MATRAVLLVGATGLVGRECLRLLVADDTVARVVLLARRALPAVAPRAGTIEAHVVDFERLSSYAEMFAVDQIVCALGTTIEQAGTQDRFRHVDHDYPLEVARLGLAAGARHFLLVSAIGADPASSIFYNRVKGEVERDLLAMGYPSVTIVRPSLLIGEREEFRLGEAIAKRLAFLIPPRYKPVDATAVAAVLVRAAREDRPGARVIESREISRLLAE